jgi:hypothetical protein
MCLLLPLRLPLLELLLVLKLDLIHIDIRRDVLRIRQVVIVEIWRRESMGRSGDERV